MNARQRYQQQAQLEAGLQIDPQIQALASLLSDKRGQYLQTRSLNASSARGIANAAQQAIPQIQQFYGGDAAHPAQGSVLAAALLGQAGPERDAFVRRMAADQTRTTSDLAQQASRASQAQVYGNQQARSQYLADKGKIVQDAYALQGQKGALTATTLGRLLDGMRQRQVTLTGQKRTADTASANRTAADKRAAAGRDAAAIRAGVDPVTGKVTPGGPKDPNRPGAPKKRPTRGLGSLTQQQEQQLVSQVEEARTWVTNLSKNMNQDAVGGALLTGQTLVDSAGNKLKVPKLPHAVVKAALDLNHPQRNGVLSRGAIDELHKAGIHIPRQWLKKPTTSTGGGIGGLLNVVDNVIGSSRASP